MIPFKTTTEQVLHLAEIVVAMKNADLPHEFIAAASEIGREDQGVYDLMVLWLEADDDEVREEVVAALQDSLDDYRDARTTPEKKPYIKFDDLDRIGEQVLARKAHLRDLVDRHGGVSEVARRCGIPQPSLSRMLRSPSMPRRTTLFRLADALGLSETDIVAEWTR